MTNTAANSDTCLVLGGGGVAGIAWMTGYLLGLQDQGVDLDVFDRAIGTSAGSAVAAQLFSGTSLVELFARQTDPSKQVAEITPSLNYVKLFLKGIPALLARNDQAKFLRRVGTFALNMKTVPAAARRAVIQERLPKHRWPNRHLSLVAIDAHTGEIRCFDASCGVDLVDAVGASCAVPGVWPVVRIKGQDYYDGALRSNDNADLAKGSAKVLILAPLGNRKQRSKTKGLNFEVDFLRSSGAMVAAAKPDQECLVAMGRNSLDPAIRTPTALAGRRQGRREAAQISGDLGF